MSRYLLISADCHAGAPVEQYRQYLEKKYWNDFDDYLAETAPTRGLDWRRQLFSEEAREAFDGLEAVKAGGTSGLWDPDRRVRELEADGVVAEVLYPDGTANNDEPCRTPGADYTPELRAAGARAYNRWLADFCACHPERRAGVALVWVHDIDAAVREIRWAREAGLRGIVIPAPEKGLPLYHDERYEPIWAACAELAMPVHVHTGSGTGRPDYGTGPVRTLLSMSELEWFSYRVMWFLIWSGAFERHPGLRFVISEQHLGWIPETIHRLDQLYEAPHFAQIRSVLSRKPSEFWNEQCRIGASFLDRRQCSMLDEIGIDTVMWGSDYPHLEGMWPESRQKLAAVLPGLPEEKVRQILGENAARTYGFDVGKLAPAVERVGPTVEEFA